MSVCVLVLSLSILLFLLFIVPKWKMKETYHGILIIIYIISFNKVKDKNNLFLEGFQHHTWLKLYFLHKRSYDKYEYIFVFSGFKYFTCTLQKTTSVIISIVQNCFFALVFVTINILFIWLVSCIRANSTTLLNVKALVWNTVMASVLFVWSLRLIYKYELNLFILEGMLPCIIVGGFQYSVSSYLLDWVLFKRLCSCPREPFYLGCF